MELKVIVDLRSTRLAIIGIHYMELKVLTWLLPSPWNKITGIHYMELKAPPPPPPEEPPPRIHYMELKENESGSQFSAVNWNPLHGVESYPYCSPELPACCESITWS